MNVMDAVSAGYGIGSLLIVSSVIGVFCTGFVSPKLRRPVGRVSAVGIIAGFTQPHGSHGC
ncbi:MAG: hypothetical protein HY420_01565 [Candidatus Kerfeldbacteria bacterium]|nr:hypothetical protein [Candidatus Kerfeldbacteria bacterium]